MVADVYHKSQPSRDTIYIQYWYNLEHIGLVMLIDTCQQMTNIAVLYQNLQKFSAFYNKIKKKTQFLACLMVIW